MIIEENTSSRIDKLKPVIYFICIVIIIYSLYKIYQYLNVNYRVTQIIPYDKSLKWDKVPDCWYEDKYNDAIYFSREPIPSISLNKVQPSMHKQICVIPFKRDYLLKFNKMEQTDLEKIESIDMLRVIENGEKVKMVYTDSPSHSVDNANDLKKVIDKMADDKLMKMYL